MSLKPKFIIRFDDVTPTSNWVVWKDIETICDNYNVKPILSVVPNNLDTSLFVNKPRLDFWRWVKACQNKGWLIAMHGFNHIYTTNNSGIVGIKNQSEWAGHSYEYQEKLLKEGLRIFEENGVSVDTWVAPGHSMDFTTSLCLKKNNFKIISDGLFPFPSKDKLGLIWIPQQIWHFRKMPFGIWTVCYHVDKWSAFDIEKFESEIKLNNVVISSWNMIESNKIWINWTIANYIVAPIFRYLLKVKLRKK